jgi:hypothetical protein
MMVDFDGMKDKAGDLAEEHGDQVDAGVDKGSDAAGERFGHEDQLDQGADKLKDAIPGGADDESNK